MSREQLEILVDYLKNEVPQLLADYPEAHDFWDAFDGLSEVGLERAEPEDKPWFERELLKITHAHGLDRPG
ncbi:hypothetical protein [Dyella sp.]|uniref:hypothetical protein n=1 Tax=Dyella sp. TaxID=1869338 RepID=UPI002ED1253F